MIVSPELKRFMTVLPREEAVGWEFYHIKKTGTSLSGTVEFFGNTVGSATDGIYETNMEKANAISSPKRFLITGIALDFVPNVEISQHQVATPSEFIEQKHNVLSNGVFKIKLIDKDYFVVAPLMRISAGMGLNGFSAIHYTQATASTATSTIEYASNGLPSPSSYKKLEAPLPLPPEVFFKVEVSFQSAITVANGSRLGVWLVGVLIRPTQ